MIYNDLLWSTMTYYDLQWPTMIYNDLLWSTLTYYDLQWPTMIYNDLLWSTMTYYDLLWSTLTYYDLHWPTLIYIDLLGPLSWGRTKLKFGKVRKHMMVTSFDTVNCHHYVTWLVTRPFLKNPLSQGLTTKLKLGPDIETKWPVWMLCTVTIMSRD